MNENLGFILEILYPLILLIAGMSVIYLLFEWVM
ncbi:MAG: hypothetical protein QG599_26 [Pseudomonadota bacterium]|nr:hypothetical protein [Pseudomonadota bacterium]